MLAFCHIPKAAGTSIKQVLRSWYGAGHYDIPPDKGRFNFIDADDIDWILKRWPQVKSVASHNLSPSNDLSNGKREVHWFTFLREPVKRYISHYQYYVNQWWGHEKIPFEEWMELDHHKNVQVKTIAGEDNLSKAIRILDEKVSVVGIQEEYRDSMKMLASFTGKFYKPGMIRKKKNVAPSRHVEEKIYRQFERHKERLNEVNNLDLALYQYVKEELFPAHREKFLSDYRPEKKDKADVRLKMKINWLVSFAVRNAIRKPLRKRFFRVIGFGNNNL